MCTYYVYTCLQVMKFFEIMITSIVFQSFRAATPSTTRASLVRNWVRRGSPHRRYVQILPQEEKTCHCYVLRTMWVFNVMWPYSFLSRLSFTYPFFIRWLHDWECSLGVLTWLDVERKIRDRHSSDLVNKLHSYSSNWLDI